MFTLKCDKKDFFLQKINIKGQSNETNMSQDF